MSKKKSARHVKKGKKEAPVCPTCEESMKKIEAWVCPGCWTVYEMRRRAPGED